MNVAVDIGNTRVKVGWFEGDTLCDQWQLPRLSDLDLSKTDRSVEAVILSSVAEASLAAASEQLRQHRPPSTPIIVLSGYTPLPFVNRYITPSTLGTDRLAAVAGAQRLHSRQNALVIDAGTCITYDVIDQEGAYQGGLISPGVQMRLRAMHTFTARLPLVKLEADRQDSHELTERSTDAGLRSGAVWGAAAEINQMIRMYADKFSDLRVMLCGGDASYLLPYVGGAATGMPVTGMPATGVPVTLVSELILIGLNSILQYNVNQKN